MLKFLNISAILTVSQIFMLQQFSIVISHWSGLAVIGVTFLFTIIRFLILEIIKQDVSIYYSGFQCVSNKNETVACDMYFESVVNNN